MAKSVIDKILVFTASTCGLGNNDLGLDSKEICLLAWQVINCGQIQPASPVEYCYIRPADPFPEGKTPIGIETKHLNKAPLISEGLKKLQSIVSSFPNNTVCLSTNGPNPLRQCVFPEMARKGLSVPEFGYSYFDLRKEFGKRTNSNVLPETLEDLCKSLGVDCPHEDVYGEEEIRVLACIVQKLLSQDHSFESPEVIKDCCKAVSIVDEKIVSDATVVRLKGLPFQADQKDIANFLAGLNVIDGGIVYRTNAIGRRTGEALVVLENEEQALLALKRNKHFMGKRYIEVFKGSADEFLEIAGDTCNTADGDTDLVFRLQGLPYKATEKDICDFFGDDITLKNGADGVFIVRYPNGRASGDAFVLMNADQDIKQVMAKNGKDMMGRYVDLFDSSMKEFLRVLKKSGSSEQLDRFGCPASNGSTFDSNPKSKRGAERNCVKLRGLPWEATAEEVIEFFGDISKHIQQHGVHMVLNSRNRPTGDCYVEMNSVESASKAAERLHKRNMGRRYIEVFQCSGTEVTFALMDSAGGGGEGRREGRREGRGEGRSSHTDYFSHDKKSSNGTGTQVRARGLAYSIKKEELVNFFEDFDIQDDDVELLCNHSGRSTGMANIIFPSVEEARRAVKELNNKYIGSRYVDLSVM